MQLTADVLGNAEHVISVRNKKTKVIGTFTAYGFCLLG